MAGWTNSSAAASGTGGGWPFTSHGTNGSGNNRWRQRGRGRPPPQPRYRYRPVNSRADAHPSSPPPPRHHSGPAMDHQGQGASSTSTRRSQPPRLPLTDKPPTPAASAVMPRTDASVQPDDSASRNFANFECNVCFDMAADPVVTKCGHLFCWECLYQWLHVHSDHRECPVCKGHVADDAIIPIYGRGGSAASVHTALPRPTGARVESYRQQQQQLEAVPDTPVDDDEDPFDLQEFRLGFGVSSLRDDVISFMASYEVDMEQHYDDYTNVYNYDDDFGDLQHLLDFPVFASAGAGPGSSQGHGVGDDLMEAFFSSDIDTRHHQPAFGYPRTNHQNHGRLDRHQRARARASASADHSSADGMVMGRSSAFYHDTDAGPNVSRGASSRPCVGWTERRGRSNRNANSATARSVQDSRRQRTNYN